MQRLKIIPCARPELVSGLYIVTRIRENHYLLKNSVAADLVLSNVKSPISSTVKNLLEKESKKDPCGKIPSLCTLTGQVFEYPVDLMKPLVSSLQGWTCHRVCGAFSLSHPPQPTRRKDAHFQTHYDTKFSLLVLSCEI